MSKNHWLVIPLLSVWVAGASAETNVEAASELFTVSRDRDGGIEKLPLSSAIMRALLEDIATPDDGGKHFQKQFMKQRSIRKERVFGPDDTRTRVSNTKKYPWRAIVRVGENCSGVFVGPRHILTAGHCVHRYGHWDEDAYTITPAQSGRTKPYGKLVAQKICTLTPWMEHMDDRYDIAMITLKDPVGDKIGWLGTRPKIRPGDTVNIASYPGDKPDGTQWTSTCVVEKTDQHYIYYRCDTYGGSSGSGVYVYFPDKKNKRYVVGVHEGAHGKLNRAVRLNGTAKWDVVEEWIVQMRN